MLLQRTHGFYLDSVAHKVLPFQVIVNCQWLSSPRLFKVEKISNIKPRIGLFSSLQSVVNLLYPLNLSQALRVSNNVESDFS